MTQQVSLVVICCLGHDIAQAVSRRLPIAAARAGSQAYQWHILVDVVALDEFSSSTLGFPASSLSTKCSMPAAICSLMIKWTRFHPFPP
jgi:hypothetical protein